MKPFREPLPCPMYVMNVFPKVGDVTEEWTWEPGLGETEETLLNPWTSSLIALLLLLSVDSCRGPGIHLLPAGCAQCAGTSPGCWCVCSGQKNGTSSARMRSCLDFLNGRERELGAWFFSIDVCWHLKVSTLSLFLWEPYTPFSPCFCVTALKTSTRIFSFKVKP